MSTGYWRPGTVAALGAKERGNILEAYHKTLERHRSMH